MTPRINRREFAMGSVAAPLLAGASPVLPGIWRFRFGTPEKLTPVAKRHYPPANDALAALPSVAHPPRTATGEASRGGYLVHIPLEPAEMIYGLGLQLQSFLQRGLKKKLRVNADPSIDSGDSHAPVPFYVTTRGYAVLIDTARYATIYCGNKRKKNSGPASKQSGGEVGANLLPSAYARFRANEASEVLIEIPRAAGVDVYVFGGPTMRNAVQRYNLFSGGGALPPRWGLGFWYRCFGQFDQAQVLAMAADLRESKIPCDVLGLEPGWQSHAYSCSFVWSDKFPDPDGTLRKLADSNFRVNLWEHAFTHPTSPIYKPLLPLSGDYEVWDGLTPDFLDPRARRIFADFHDKEHVASGVA
ncbi:MAG: glycoside hydrolase, partial [Acidobacteriota bacterium]|nr:glycoside hydrolase [Acidobacteriota bacterium]